MHECRHVAAAVVEFLYGNTSIVEKIVILAYDFLIGKLFTSDVNPRRTHNRKALYVLATARQCNTFC